MNLTGAESQRRIVSRKRTFIRKKTMGAKERREREKEQRRQQILDAARELLFEKGLNGATVSQVARSAELSVGLIYFYFQSKEEIFAALQEEGLEILFTMIEKAGDTGKTSIDKLKNIALAYLRFSTEYKSYYDILNYFITAPDRIFPEHLKSRIDTHGDRILTLVDKILEEGTRAGELNVSNPREYSLILWVHVHGFPQLRKLQDTLLRGKDFDRLFASSISHLLESIKK